MQSNTKLKSKTPAEKCPCGSGQEYKKCCGKKTKIDASKRHPLELILFKEAVTAFNDQRFLHSMAAVKELFKHRPYHLGALKLLFQSPDPRKVFSQEELIAICQCAEEVDSDDIELLYGCGVIYENFGDNKKALEKFNAIKRLDSESFLAHWGLGRIAQRQRQYDVAEFHFRSALHKNNYATQILNNLGALLNHMGRKEEAEHQFRIALTQAPYNCHCLINWCNMEESKGNMEKAWALFNLAESHSDNPQQFLITKAALFRRSKDYKFAINVLDQIDVESLRFSEQAAFWYEKNKTLDKMGLYDQAFECADNANGIKSIHLGHHYNDKKQLKTAESLKSFFTEKYLKNILKAQPINPNEPQPIFICGFTRSGTSMLEQIISSHPNICGGDELPFIYDLAANTNALLKTNRKFPGCLKLKQRHPTLTNTQLIRAQYLNRLKLTSILEPGVHRFTDKMPMNEMHLGLINLIFPASKVIHIVRHPLDSVLSSYFTDATHGSNCTYNLESCAKHYNLLHDLTEHYLDNLNIDYIRIRYEDIVDDITNQVKSVLDFLEEPFNNSCINFHENSRHSRTASYAQVKEKLYTSSRYRYKNYLKQAEGIIQILRPTIEMLGYEIR